MRQREKDILRIGDTVMWRGGWGQNPAKEAVVAVIEAEADLDDRVGQPVNMLPWSKVPQAIITLTNGHWAYGDQIRPLSPEGARTERIASDEPI